MQIAEQERIASPTFVLAWVVSFLQFLAFYALVTTMAVYAVRQFAASDAGAATMVVYSRAPFSSRVRRTSAMVEPFWPIAT